VKERLGTGAFLQIDATVQFMELLTIEERRSLAAGFVGSLASATGFKAHEY
jgi:hypothetical protein